jgi:hypothetical protein
VATGTEYDLELLVENWGDMSPEDREAVLWKVGVEAYGEIEIMDGTEPSNYYSVQLPNAAADAILEGEDHGITFVEYLRLSFRWGGFPGWEKYENRPEKELAFLREGLLPI